MAINELRNVKTDIHLTVLASSHEPPLAFILREYIRLASATTLLYLVLSILIEIVLFY